MKTTITPPRYEGRVTVGDQRQLGIAEFGPAGADRTVVWFHGTPGARRQIPQPARRYADEHGVRVIGIDRPGVGLSTPHRYHNLLDFTDDLAIALDRLGVTTFSTVGLSGGAPYALAAAYALADRVPSVGILSGVVPSGGQDGAKGGLVGLASTFKPFLPLMSEPAGVVLGGLAKTAGRLGPVFLSLYARVSPPGDRAVLESPEHRDMFLDDIINSGRHGMRAAGFDAILFTRYWGFSVRDITAPVTWWHGDADNIIPFAHGEHIVALLPNAELIRRPGEGHLGGFAIGDQVLETVLAVDGWRTAPPPSAAG